MQRYETKPKPYNLITLKKGKERYIIIFPDSKKQQARYALGNWASNTDLSFTWYDAATISRNIRGS